MFPEVAANTFQIEECRISKRTKSELIHLGNRRSLRPQTSLPKSHCRESIWRSCPKQIETTKTPRSLAVPMSQKVLHLPWSSCWWRKWKTQEETRKKKGKILGNNENLKNCDVYMFHMIFHDLCLFLRFVCHRFSAESGKPGGLSGFEIGIDPRQEPGRQSSMFWCCAIWFDKFDISFCLPFILAHLQILGIHIEGTWTCFRAGIRRLFVFYEAVQAFITSRWNQSNVAIHSFTCPSLKVTTFTSKSSVNPHDRMYDVMRILTSYKWMIVTVILQWFYDIVKEVLIQLIDICWGLQLCLCNHRTCKDGHLGAPSFKPWAIQDRPSKSEDGAGVPRGIANSV